jgi:hypothetical protein
VVICVNPPSTTSVATGFQVGILLIIMPNPILYLAGIILDNSISHLEVVAPKIATKNSSRLSSLSFDYLMLEMHDEFCSTVEMEDKCFPTLEVLL